jgi:phospholipase/carboxylesterase
MTAQLLNTLEIEPAGPAHSSVIWMHGLGAGARDFEPIVPELKLPVELGIRFVFPNAPIRPVTINNGMQMRAWYNVLSLDLPRQEDAEGVYASEQAINVLLEREKQRGIPAERIVLAGFSQGGVMALHTGLRYPERLAGILALSCYIPLAARLSNERGSANQATPWVMKCAGRKFATSPNGCSGCWRNRRSERVVGRYRGMSVSSAADHFSFSATCLRVGLALGRFHHLPNEKAEQLVLAGAVLGQLIGIGGDHVINHFFNR